MSTLEMHAQFDQANAKQREALQRKGDVMVDIGEELERIADKEQRDYLKTLFAQLLQDWATAVEGLTDSQQAIADHQADVEAES